jgi:hypothetical protein
MSTKVSPNETAAAPEKKGRFRTFLVGLGCGCVYPAVFAIILILTGLFFLADPFRLAVTVPTLPAFAGPEQEHFWSLQEKRLDQENAKDPVLQLTPGEFNAFLSSMQFLPAAGLCIHRVRFVPQENSGRFYLIASGFFMRNLIVQIEIRANDRKTGDLMINSLLLPAGSWINAKAISFLHDVLVSSKIKAIEDIFQGKSEFSFDHQSVTIRGGIGRQD